MVALGIRRLPIQSMRATTRRLSEVQMDEDSNVRVYLSGYADGEGCFCVTFNRSKRHKFGWEIRPSFSVSQNGDRSEVLVIYQQLFGCGTIRPDRSYRTLSGIHSARASRMTSNGSPRSCSSCSAALT